MATNNPAPLLQQIKPRNIRAARALKAREPKPHEDPKRRLLLRAAKCSLPTQLFLRDLNTLTQSHAVQFTKKNADIHPFESATSLEFFAEKNDVSLIVFASHSKKRPHALTFVRTFEHKVLDMLELLLDAEGVRTLSQFKNKRKAQIGMRPLVSFVGDAFESPVENEYTLAKSMLLDFFAVGGAGGEATSKEIDVTGLQYMINISAAGSSDAASKPQIHLRTYMLHTKRAGTRLPLVNLEEMGPRADFFVGRHQLPDPSVWKEAMKKPTGTAVAKPKKNIETDLIGDKMGRIHVGKQDLSKLQTRKMRGLKRQRGDGDDGVEMEGVGGGGGGGGESVVNGDGKRVRI